MTVMTTLNLGSVTLKFQSDEPQLLVAAIEDLLGIDGDESKDHLAIVNGDKTTLYVHYVTLLKNWNAHVERGSISDQAFLLKRALLIQGILFCLDSFYS